MNMSSGIIIGHRNLLCAKHQFAPYVQCGRCKSLICTHRDNICANRISAPWYDATLFSSCVRERIDQCLIF